MRKRGGLAAGGVVFRVLGYSAVLLFCLACIVPFYFMVVASFESESVILRNGFGPYVRSFTLSAYGYCLASPIRIFWAYRTTLIATLLGATGSVLLAAMTGYVLQRRDFPWRNAFSFFFFFTTLFSGGLVPWYILCVRYLGFRNSYAALVLPLMFSVWNLIVARNYIRGIPYEITESAKMDGAGDFRIFVKLIMPICKPLLAGLALFSALAYWNDWFSSLLFITDERMMSLQYFLQRMVGSIQALKLIASSGGTLGTVVLPQESMKMAMTVIAVGPILLVYPFVQRFFVKGLTIGAVKG
jgi:putative aldouronate transport system permease protein